VAHGRGEAEELRGLTHLSRGCYEGAARSSPASGKVVGLPARSHHERWAERLVKTRGIATLSNDQSKATVQLLLHLDPTSVPEWPYFIAHLQRRNDIVHGGQAVGHDDAAASITAVQQLWVRLSDAARGSAPSAQL
jgi:hypothetical protein